MSRACSCPVVQLLVFQERRKELPLDKHSESLDNAVDELGCWVDHLRQVGIRGFITEHTGEEDFTFIGGEPPTIEPESFNEWDESESGDTGEHQ